MSEEPKQSEEKAARPLQALAPSGTGPACRHPQMTRNGTGIKLEMLRFQGFVSSCWANAASYEIRVAPAVPKLTWDLGLLQPSESPFPLH